MLWVLLLNANQQINTKQRKIMEFIFKTLYYNNIHRAGISQNEVTRLDPGPTHPTEGLHIVEQCSTGDLWKVSVRVTNKKPISKRSYWPESGHKYTLLVAPIEKINVEPTQTNTTHDHY